MHTTTRRSSEASDLPAHRSRADEVYDQLKRDVAEFSLVPGDRFTENELSERLGVSRTPVRQALFRLQQEGYVEVLFRSGWRVLNFPKEAVFRGTNYVLWLGKPGEYRAEVPAGLKFLEGQAAKDKWHEVRNRWLEAHGYETRSPNDWDPMKAPMAAPRRPPSK